MSDEHKYNEIGRNKMIFKVPSHPNCSLSHGTVSVDREACASAPKVGSHLFGAALQLKRQG